MEGASSSLAELFGFGWPPSDREWVRLNEFFLLESSKFPGAPAGTGVRAASDDWLLSESSLGMGEGGITVTLGFMEEVSEAKPSWFEVVEVVEVVTGWAIVGTVIDMEGLFLDDVVERDCGRVRSWRSLFFTSFEKKPGAMMSIFHFCTEFLQCLLVGLISGTYGAKTERCAVAESRTGFGRISCISLGKHHMHKALEVKSEHTNVLRKLQHAFLREPFPAKFLNVQIRKRPLDLCLSLFFCLWFQHGIQQTNNKHGRRIQGRNGAFSAGM